jgi:hypothetical protein
MAARGKGSRRLSEEDAIQLWIARAARVKVRELTQRYGVDSRRLYEVWTEQRWPKAREKALERLKAERSPLAVSARLSRHRTISTTVPPEQLSMFGD